MYRTATAALRPWAASSGFTRPEAPHRPGSWTGTWSGVPVAFNIQVDKWEWSDEEGSKFTVNFEARFPTDSYQVRYGELLRRRLSPQELTMTPRAWNGVSAIEGADKDAFGSLARRVVAKLPHPGERRELDTSLDSSSTDPWMRYWDLTDVASWFETFIVPRLPRMLDALALGKPKPLSTPQLALPSLSVVVEGDQMHLRLSVSDAERMHEALRNPWDSVIAQGLTHTLTLEQGGGVRGPIGPVDASSGKVRRIPGRSTRGVLVEMLETPALGHARAVEDRAGSARFDTRVTLEVHA